MATPAKAQEARPTRAELKTKVEVLEKENAELKARLGLKEEPPVIKTAAIEGWGKVTWGMSPEQVKKAYKGLQTDGEGNLLTEKLKVTGADAAARFDFVDGKLAQVIILFTQTHTNNNKYVDDFESTSELMKGKYGAPQIERQAWSKDLFKDDPGHIGTALVSGHVQWFALWSTSQTEITHGLNGGNFKARHLLIYKSIALNEARQEAADKEKMNDL